MVLKYQLLETHWLSIENDITPYIDVNFLVFDDQENPPALYYVKDGKKLYILLEKPIPNDQSKTLQLFFENQNTTNHILNYDQIKIDQFDSDEYELGSYIWTDWKPAVTKIKSILESISEDHKMPDNIQNLFLQKYFKKN
nr:hypothetical protein [Abalone asfa-like virus]